MKTQIGGLTWLESVDHLPERYEEELKKHSNGAFQKWRYAANAKNRAQLAGLLADFMFVRHQTG